MTLYLVLLLSKRKRREIFQQNSRVEVKSKTPEVREVHLLLPYSKNRKTVEYELKTLNRKPITFTPDKYEDKKVEVVFNTTALEDRNLNLDCSDRGLSGDTEKDRSGSINPDFVDSFSNSFKKKFLWPTRFLELETRKLDEPIKPIEIREVGKNPKQAFYGQIPKLNLGKNSAHMLVSNLKMNWNGLILKYPPSSKIILKQNLS